MEKNIALLRGDGIGPEIVDSAGAVLKVGAEKFGHTFNFTPYLIGGAAIDATGKIVDETTGETFQAVALPPFIEKIVEHNGLLPYLKARMEKGEV